jgi:hypothetical protein
MQFNSYIFICIFLPVVIIGYFLGNKINLLFGKIILIVASIWFYTYAGWSTFVIIAVSILLNFTCAFWSRKKDKGNSLLLADILAKNRMMLEDIQYHVRKNDYEGKKNMELHIQEVHGTDGHKKD